MKFVSPINFCLIQKKNIKFGHYIKMRMLNVINKRNPVIMISRRKWKSDVPTFFLTAYLIVVFYNLDSAYSLNHCYTHHYKDIANSSYMQFTKEVVSSEYAVYGGFKSLHCCVKGYRSIEWFKDGFPYPWMNDVSSLILYPEAANQTIYTRQVQNADVGKYTCVLRNDTYVQIHNIDLEIKDTIPDMPLATFYPENQIVQINDSARLYCEAFVGSLTRLDENQIFWYQVSGGMMQKVEGELERVSRENGQIVGSYLTIPKMKPHNYGKYLCRIKILNCAKPLEVEAFINPLQGEKNQTLWLALVAAVFAMFIVIILWNVVIYFWRSYKNNREHCQALTNDASC